MTIARPQGSEFNEYYGRYIDQVPASGPVAMLTDQIARFQALRELSDQQGAYRYAADKWTVKDVIGHMADTERLFSYRLLHVARNDQAPLPGMDEKVWSASAPHASRPVREVVDEMIAVRRATIALVQSLDAAALSRAGVASGFQVSARALAWILPGHAAHHLQVLRERYNITAA